MRLNDSRDEIYDSKNKKTVALTEVVGSFHKKTTRASDAENEIKNKILQQEKMSLPRKKAAQVDSIEKVSTHNYIFKHKSIVYLQS